jgi:RNA polymerase sigma factor (sigma-70 family)
VAAVILNETIDSDEMLIARARVGDSHAYATLYERHRGAALAAARCLTRSASDADDVVSESFARVLNVLRGGKGPLSAFRPYLMTVVRNTVYERTRRGRETPSDLISDIADIATADAADRDAEARIARQAFESLPERWQLILWHTEVEGRSPADVAPLLGLAPNSVAALAYRAREGLRQTYLQAHVGAQRDRDCRAFGATFGAYVRDSMPARERAALDAHLAICEPCRITLEELRPTNERLRVLLIFAFLGVPAAKYLDELDECEGVRKPAYRKRPSRRVARIVIGATVAAAVVVGGVSLAARGDTNVTPVAFAAVTTVSATTPSTNPATTVVSTTTVAGTTTSTVVATTTVLTSPAVAVVKPPITQPLVTAAPTTTEAVNTTTTYLIQNLDMTGTPNGVGVAGGTAEILIHVANTGPYDIANAQIVFGLPAGFEVQPVASGIVCVAGSNVCSLGLMHPGDSLNFAVQISIPIGAISPLNWGLFVLEGTSSATTDPIPFV